MDDTILTEHPRKRAANDRSAEDHLVTAARGGSIGFAGNLFEFAISVFFTTMVTRWLGATAYGLYKLALTIVSALGNFSTLGMVGGLNRFIPIARNERNPAKIWGLIQVGVGLPGIIGLSLAGIVIIAADLISVRLFEDAALAPVLRVSALAIPLSALALALSGVTAGFKRIEYEVYSQRVAFNLLKLGFSALVLFAGMGLAGITWSYVVAELIAMTMLVYFLHGIFPLRRAISSAQRNLRELFDFSIPLFLSQFLTNFGRKFETIVLGIFGIMSDVGIYSVILIVSDFGNMGFTALRKISAPIIAELHHKKDREQLKRFYQATTKWGLMLNIPFFLSMVLFAEDMLQIFGKEFSAGSVGLIILAAGTMVNATTGTCGTVINMVGKSRVTLINSVVYMGVTLLFDFTMIPAWGLIGAAWAGSLSIVVVNLLRMVQVYFLVEKLWPFEWTILKPVAASLGAAGLTLAGMEFLDSSEPLLRVGILLPGMWLAYAGGILLLKLSDDDRMIVGKFVKRFGPNNRKNQKRNGIRQ